MYVVPAFQPGVTLFRKDGTTVYYKTMEAALHKLGYHWICNNVREDFTRVEVVDRVCYGISKRWTVREDVIYSSDYVMRDDLGKKITARDFYELREKKVKQRRYGGSLWQWNGEGPVPGIHKVNAGGSCHRRMRHMNERRAAFHFPEEGEVAPRAKRSTKNLPNPWDDYVSSAWGDNGWKRFRKTQWRMKKAK